MENKWYNLLRYGAGDKISRITLTPEPETLETCVLLYFQEHCGVLVGCFGLCVSS